MKFEIVSVRGRKTEEEILTKKVDCERWTRLYEQIQRKRSFEISRERTR